MGSRNGHWAGNGNLILGTGKWAGKWKFPYWASTGWDAIVVVVVELEIFESLEINICLLKHLETSCIRQKSPAGAMHC